MSKNAHYGRTLIISPLTNWCSCSQGEAGGPGQPGPAGAPGNQVSSSWAFLTTILTFFNIRNTASHFQMGFTVQTLTLGWIAGA